MKLPLGGQERQDLKWNLQQDIVELADKWERAREKAVILQSVEELMKSVEEFHRVAEKLATAVRKWRKL